jgi:hypothetical protein
MRGNAPNAHHGPQKGRRSSRSQERQERRPFPCAGPPLAPGARLAPARRRQGAEATSRGYVPRPTSRSPKRARTCASSVEKSAIARCSAGGTRPPAEAAPARSRSASTTSRNRRARCSRRCRSRSCPTVEFTESFFASPGRRRIRTNYGQASGLPMLRIAERESRMRRLDAAAHCAAVASAAHDRARDHGVNRPLYWVIARS